MIKKLLSSFFIFSLLIVSAKAQTPPAYAFQSASGTFTPVSGGTVVPLTYNGATNSDDGVATPANAINIGFTFNYNGTNYTQIRPCANGWATFSTTALTNNTDTWTNNLTTGPAANQRPFIAPLWDDLDLTAGTVSYVLTGTSPNRILTIEWLNAKWDYNASAACISFQIKLYETSNIIEFVYRPEAGTVAANSGGASIGICGTATGSNNFISLSDASANPQVSYTIETTNILSKPATGQIYRWIPYCSASATNTTGEKISNFTYNTINNTSSSTAGYENFTNVSTTVNLIPTSTLPFSVNVSSFTGTDQVLLYIDFNHNGVFTDPGETVFTSSTPLSAGTISGSITIPALSSSVLQGPTRLRIRLHDTGNGPNPTSCGTSNTGQVEDYTVNIQPCFAATITTQPANAIICNGGNGPISIATTGTGITYQWQVSTDGGITFNNISNGALYSGITTNTLNIFGATLSMAGYKYRVLLNGTCTASNTPSNSATLTINTAAAITSQPVNAKICKGNSTSFTVGASGSSPSYQWQVSTDGGITYSDLSGATSATLTINNADVNLNGNRYRCVVTVSSCGSVISSGAILTVNALPVVTISSDPVSQIKPGQNVYVTVGSVPAAVSFSWTFNGVTIAGANTNSVLANVNGIGTYRATVTDTNGCVNSSQDLAVTSLPSPVLFIYPNPSNGKFQVRYYSRPGWLHLRTIQVYNAMGILVAQKDFVISTSYAQMDFDLRNLPAGMYTLRIPEWFEEKEAIGQFIIIK